MVAMPRHSLPLAGSCVPFGSKRAELERLMTGTGVPKDERKGLKWIHKATFQGFQPAIDYCKEHGYKWY